MILNDILLYSLISALSSRHLRGILKPQIGAGAETHSQTFCEERESKFEVSIVSLPWAFWESGGKGNGKIVRVRENGGHQENIVH